MESAGTPDLIAAAVDLHVAQLLALVVVLSVLSALATHLFLRKTNKREHPNNTSGVDFLSDHCVFLFSGKALTFATSDAHALLHSITGDDASWDKLERHFQELSPNFSKHLVALNEHGTPFFVSTKNEAGDSYEVEGRPHQGYALVTVSKLSAEKRAHQRTQTRDNSAVEETDKVVELLDAAPCLLWRRKADGTILWANDQLLKIANVQTPGQARTALMLPQSLLPPNEDTSLGAERRVSIKTGSEDAEQWLRVQEQANSDGDIIGFATSADDIVKVELTLGRFVATLTESFAHLSTGLAIFDADRRLTIFNPAIADLVQIDPGWLATSPGFREVMDRIREGQMMPEHKNSREWKAHIQDIETKAEQGTLTEKWVLPSGQTFKLTGRPHPHGAIALMIEDISTHISLETQYKSEIEQSRATLDYLTESVAVFDTTGALVYTNSAFVELWGFDPQTSKQPPNIVSITADWSAACCPTPVWGDLREFVTGIDQRASWTADLELKDGRLVQAVFAPLPDGSTLTTFTKTRRSSLNDGQVSGRLIAQSRAHDADISLLELAIEHMREAVQMLNVELGGKKNLEAAPDQNTDPVREVMNYADRLLLLRNDQANRDVEATDSLSADLLAIIDEKDATLSLSCEDIIEDGQLSAGMKRLLINMMLVARSLITPQTNIDLSVVAMDEGLTISCMFKTTLDAGADPATAAGLPYRIMMRYIEEQAGHGEISHLDERGFVKISCTVPKPTTSETQLLVGSTAL